MAKTKKKTEEVVEPTETEETTEQLSDLRWPAGDNEESDFGGLAGDAVAQLRELGNLALAYADTLTVDEAVVAYTMLKEAGSVAKELQDALKDAALVRIGDDAGGKAEGELGSVQVSHVEAGTESVFTDETVALLETKGVLNRAVCMVATMHEGIDVSKISDDDLDVLQRYFDVEYVPDAEKIEGLIKLGELDRDEINETIETETTRKGYSRVVVKANDNVMALFVADAMDDDISDEELLGPDADADA